MSTSDNIDVFVNKLGYDIVNNLKGNDLKFIDKALGVLVNDGVYAYYVFCKSKEKKNNKLIKEIFIDNLLKSIEENEFLREYFLVKEIRKEEDKYETFFRNLSSDIHKLLFFRDILERALVYARYHAKALSGDSNE